MSSGLINFYEKMGDGFKHKFELDKNYNKHLIEPTSNILIIGQTGSGKTNALMNFLQLKNDSFVEIIIFTGSTSDEPLYNYLKTNNPEIKIIDDVEELPELQSFNDVDKTKERLIVFDDVSGLGKKKEEVLKNFIKACRKYAFTAIFLYQSYTSAPKFIRDNCQIFFIFKQSSTVSLRFILKEKIQSGVSLDDLIAMYDYATQKKGDFFCIDTKAEPQKMFRHNFKEVLEY